MPLSMGHFALISQFLIDNPRHSFKTSSRMAAGEGAQICWICPSFTQGLLFLERRSKPSSNEQATLRGVEN